MIPMIVKYLTGNKPILALAIVVAIIGYSYNRILASRVDAAKIELQMARDDLAAMGQANAVKDAYIASMAKSQQSIEKFLNDQKQALERIDHDAPIDPDILGHDFFASLYGHK